MFTFIYFYIHVNKHKAIRDLLLFIIYYISAIVPKLNVTLRGDKVKKIKYMLVFILEYFYHVF